LIGYNTLSYCLLQAQEKYPAKSNRLKIDTEGSTFV
jgi:hypothetical protein